MKLAAISTLFTGLIACAPMTGDTAATTPTAQPDSIPAPPTDRSSATQRILSLRGSNTIGFAYAPKLVRAFLEMKGATHIEMHDEMRAKQTVWFKAELRGTVLWIEIGAPGTKWGFASLADGHTDVVMASRPINDEERGKLASLGDLTAPASEHVIATDGVAVIANADVALSKLTIEDLRRVFDGEIKDWAELQWPHHAIHTFGRDQLSGTHDTFESLVMDGKELVVEKQFEDSAELARTVATTSGAIGYVGLPYVGDTKVLAISDGDSEPLLPSPFTVATEDYALSRRLFLYVPASPKDPLASELVDFALSDAGQQLISDAGFVPLSLKIENRPLPATAPTDYVKLAKSATRMSVDFRFKLNSADIDTKATRDLDRLAHYLASPVNRGRMIFLVGFTDAQGTDAANLALGKQRADSIAKLLDQRGVRAAGIASYGRALPVATNANERGRARNRRVEVWVQ
jgi:phosphate transport system substrate-binding protein